MNFCFFQFLNPLNLNFLFLYESLSGLLGAITLLWIARRWGSRMRPGDLFLIFIIWYAAVRFFLETFREGNWTFFGVPTAMVVSVIAIVASLLVLAYRHRPAAAGADRWGEPPVTEDEPKDGEEWVEVDEEEVDDGPGDDGDDREEDDGDDEVDDPDDARVPGDEGVDRDPA